MMIEWETHKDQPTDPRMEAHSPKQQRTGSNSSCSFGILARTFRPPNQSTHTFKSDDRSRSLDRLGRSRQLGLSSVVPIGDVFLLERRSTSGFHCLSSPPQLACGSTGNDVLKRTLVTILEQPEVPESVLKQKKQGCDSGADTRQDRQKTTFYSRRRSWPTLSRDRPTRGRCQARAPWAPRQ